MTKHFTYLMRVRYGECDPQNVVFNARYADYTDIAATEFMRAIWGDYKNILAQGIDTQVVNLNISWKSSARFDDILALEVFTQCTGNSSFTLHTTVRHYETGDELATAEVVYVMVSCPEYVKQPIPDNLRETLEAGAPSVVVNHAGV